MKSWSLNRSKVAASVATSIFLVGSPAAAMNMDDLFGWLVGDGGDGPHAQSNDVVVQALQTTFVQDPIESVAVMPEPKMLAASLMPEELVASHTFVTVPVPADQSAQPVPEPTSALLFSIGALVIARARRRP